MKELKELRFIGITLAALWCVTNAHAQLTLEKCKQLAHDNYPSIKQYGLIEKSRDYNLDNASMAWMPQVKVSASTYAYTDPLKMPPALSRTAGDIKNYMAMGQVQVNQTVWDGGQIQAQQDVIKAESEVQKHQLSVSLYDINERVEDIYFGILLLDEQLRQVALLQKDLAVSQQTVAAMMKGGVANQSDADAISVELVQAKQKEVSLKASRQAFCDMLSTFIHEPVTEQTVLQRPSEKLSTGSMDVLRPELSYYQAQQNLLDAQRKSLDTKLRPRVSAFGLATYHTSVSDLAHNGLLAIGFTASWNIGALYTRKNDIAKLQLQQEQINTQRETFLFNNSLQNKQLDGQISSLQKLIVEDDKIIDLRERIRQKSELKVKNGIESVNELIRNIDAVSVAKQNKALHELQLLQEIYKIHNLNNN